MALLLANLIRISFEFRVFSFVGANLVFARWGEYKIRPYDSKLSWRPPCKYLPCKLLP